MAKVKTPVLDKMLAVKGESQCIGSFLAWLAEQQCVKDLSKPATR